MKNLATQWIHIWILLIVGSLQFSFSQTTHTVNYSIPDWNTTGSFTFETGTTENPESKKVEGYIKITNNEAVIVEINSHKLEAMIQQIELSANVKADGTNKFIQTTDRKNELLNKLKSLKAILENRIKMQNLIAKIKKELDGPNSLNWDYNASTIRAIELEVTGTVD